MYRILRSALFLCCLLIVDFAFGQCDFRQKKVWFIDSHGDKKETVFFLSPGLKIAHEKLLFFNKKTYHFKTGTSFQYRTIKINGLNGSYTKSVAAVAAADCKSARFVWPSGISEIKGYQNVYRIIGNEPDQLNIELDLDAIVQPAFAGAASYETFFNALTNDLFIRIADREGSKSWVHGITQEIVGKIFENLPILPQASLNRYLMIKDNAHSFVLLNPDLALQVDNVIKQRPDLPYSTVNSPQPENDRFWNFQLVGATTIRFYRGETGELMQTPFLSVNGPTQSNYLSNSKVTPEPVLQAGTADIQLSSDLLFSRFISLYQADLKANSGQAQKGEDALNEFAASNSELWFFEKLSEPFLKAVNGNGVVESDNPVRISTFGQRSLITPMVPVWIKDRQVFVKFGGTVGLLKQQMVLPKLKKICISRLFKGTYRKVPAAGDELLLMPGDQLTY